MRAWGPPEQRRSTGGRGGGWRLRLVAVAGRGAADRSVGSDLARARGPGSLTDLPRFFRSVAHGGRGCNPGPRAWSARRGRAVACARGGVAWRATCGCAATTYRDLRPGGYCASGACSTRRVASIALVVVCGRRPYFARRRRHVRQQDSPRVFPDPHAMEGAARCIHVLGVSVTRGRRPRRRRRGWLVCAAE
jgi:hypothetical protein